MPPEKFSFDMNEVLRLLGKNTSADSRQTRELAERACALVEESAAARHVSRRFGIGFVKSGVVLEGTDVTLWGESIFNHLLHCRECILFCATLGQQAEVLLRRWQVKDLAFAVVLDACASAAIEAHCDELQNEMQRAAEREGLFIAERFSPGYGDFSIEQQREICAVLDTGRRVGVTVSESGILIPRKSITAVVGISHSRRPRREEPCDKCVLRESCQLRKEGRRCWKN
jgi:hypothetical protein